MRMDMKSLYLLVPLAPLVGAALAGLFCRVIPRWFAHSVTKTMLNQEWAMGIEEMIESEAQAQALCMLTQDFKRAFEAFAAKQSPRFEGN